MEILLDGECVEITPESVRSGLERHTPGGVRKYWVEIDGARWPVKQVITLATGVDGPRFQSRHARLWLANLGFAIGVGSRPALHGQDSRRSAPGACVTVDPSDLPVLDSLAVDVSFDWLHAGCITLDGVGRPKFPPLPRLPGLYRFDLGTDVNGVRTVYIGESAQLTRRARNYRNATIDRTRQRTSRRIHLALVQHLRAGGAVDFAVATQVLLGGGHVTDLRLKSARRLAENAAVLMAQTTPSTRVLNMDADLGEMDGDR